MNKNLLLLLCCIISLWSCTKKEKDTENGRSSVKKNSLNAIGNNFGYSDWPDVNNGMLVFRDTTHFLNYNAFLESAVDPENYDSFAVDASGAPVEFDQNQILEDIETGLGFNSIRSIAHKSFLIQDAAGWSTLEGIPEEHFISSMLMKSVLDPHLTVQIGTDYVHFINKNLSVKVAVSQKEVSDAFFRLPSNSTLYDVLHIDPTHLHSTVFDLEGSGNLVIYGPGPYHPTGEVSILNLKHKAADCLNPMKITFLGMQMFEYGSGINDPGTSLPATFTVDFDDNTTPLVIHSSGALSLFAQIVPDFVHTYASPGDYTVHIHAQADYIPPGGGSPTADYEYPITVLATNCAISSKETEEDRYVVGDGSRAVSGKIIVENFQQFSVYKTRIISETTSWFWNGSKWKQSSIEIWGDS